MTEWTMTRPGYRTKTIQRGPATIIVQRPILSDEERATQERRTRAALEFELGEHLKRKRVHRK